MVSSGRKYGDISNLMGNLLGMGDGSQAYKSQVNSPKGYYYVEFNKKYRGVSEKDIALKEKYALELVSKHIGSHQDFIRLTPKKENLTETSLDTVYYVHRGKAIIGKISISVRRYGNLNELIFIYQKKFLRSKNTGGGTKRANSSSLAKARANKRKSNRNRKPTQKRTL